MEISWTPLALAAVLVVACSSSPTDDSALASNETDASQGAQGDGDAGVTIMGPKLGFQRDGGGGIDAGPPVVDVDAGEEADAATAVGDAGDHDAATPCSDVDGDGTCDADDPCPLDKLDDRDGDDSCDADDPCPADFCDLCMGGEIPERCDQVLWEFSYGSTDIPDPMTPFSVVLTAEYPAKGEVVRHEIPIPVTPGGSWTGDTSGQPPSEFSDILTDASSPGEARYLGRWVEASNAKIGPQDGRVTPNPIVPGERVVTASVSGTVDDGARSFNITLRLRGY